MSNESKRMKEMFPSSSSSEEKKAKLTKSIMMILQHGMKHGFDDGELNLSSK